MHDAITEAADELERRAEGLNGQADFALSRELVELAARLRHVARWLDRPPTTSAPPAAAATATEPLLLTPREAAQRLNLSTRTLARLVEAGELKPLKRGRYVRFAVGELDEFAARKPGGKEEGRAGRD